jgi:hypothetical protein
MKTGVIIGISILIFLFLFLFINLLIWIVVSRKLYVKAIVPGEIYSVGERIYQVPNLPLKGNAKILNEKYLAKQRDVLEQVVEALNELDIEYWISGGTLLGFTRHETFIPWDDDCDLHTHWKNREYMFSPQFGNDISTYGLEAIFLIGVSLNFATRNAAAVRIREKKTYTPICDIFFVKETETGEFAKVDSWNGQKIDFNNNERWDKDMLFPTKKQTIDGLHLTFPNQPVDTLKVQYGDNVLTQMNARDVLFSHLYPFSVLPWIWVTHN